MERFRIIVHGGHAEDPNLREVVERLRDEDLFVDVRPTWEANDALALAAEAAALGVDVIIAAGGDGTLHEVVNGISKLPERPALAVLPLGTANDFATALGLDAKDPAQIADVIARGERRPIDVVKIGDRFCVNVATGGFAVETSGEMSDGLKDVFGGLAYLLTGVARLGDANEQKLTLRGPDFSWEGAFYGFAIANAHFAGGGHQVAPKAKLDDGSFDIVLLPSSEPVFRAVRLGGDLKIRAVDEHVERWQVPWVELESDEPLRLNLDGEPYAVRSPVRCEVASGHLVLCAPRNDVLFSTSS